MRNILIDISLDVRHLPSRKLSHILRLSNLYDAEIEPHYLAEVIWELIDRGEYISEMKKITGEHTSPQYVNELLI